MTTIGIEARVGARWWADKIRSDFFPDDGADPSSPTKHPLAIGLIGMVQAKQREKLTSEKIAAYEAALAREIQAIIDKYGTATYFGALSLGIDYGPGEAHCKALEAAGIEPPYITLLPWKTTMWVEPGRVAVGDGYGAASRDLPLVVEEERYGAQAR